MVFRLGAGLRRRARGAPSDSRSGGRAGEPATRGVPGGGSATRGVPGGGSATPGALGGDGSPSGDGLPPAWPASGAAVRANSVVLASIDRSFVQVFALVGEAIAGATHALLACDRDAAKELMARDELVDQRIAEIGTLAQRHLVGGETTEDERRELVVVLRMLPDLDRNGDLAEHIARRAARGLGPEMSARSRGLVERMGEVAATIWSDTADAFAERSASAAGVVDALDDEMDDLHVSLTAELVAGTMPLPVAIELAMVARFYERFGDHAVNLARRMASLVTGAPAPGGSGPD